MSESKIGDIVSSLLSGMHGISRSETIVGEPQQAGEATVIPVHRLKIAFGAGSAAAGAKTGKGGGRSGGYGVGGAVELDPVAVIAISKQGHAHLLTVDGEETNTWARLLEEVPEIVGRLAQSVGERVRLELNARGAPRAETGVTSEAAQPALADPKRD